MVNVVVLYGNVDCNPCIFQGNEIFKQKKFKKAHGQVIETIPLDFSNKEYIERFKYMFPDKILLIERERNYWYGKRIIRKNLSKIRCKGMSLETDSFILSTSKHSRKIKR